jgi:hypothetical protein
MTSTLDAGSPCISVVHDRILKKRQSLSILKAGGHVHSGSWSGSA